LRKRALEESSARLFFVCRGCYPGRAVQRWISMTLASLWLTLAITIAAAGVASPSADDSRLLPYGPAAHLWLCPKVGNPLPTAAVISPTAKIAARQLASPSSTIDRTSGLLRESTHAAYPGNRPHRRLAPRSRCSDPPLAA
jgi:hypothetical protein